MQIILDTNALVYAAKNKLDLVQTLKEKFGLLAIYIPNLVIEELKILVNTADKASDRENNTAEKNQRNTALGRDGQSNS